MTSITDVHICSSHFIQPAGAHPIAGVHLLISFLGETRMYEKSQAIQTVAAGARVVAAIALTGMRHEP